MRVSGNKNGTFLENVVFFLEFLFADSPRVRPLGTAPFISCTIRLAPSLLKASGLQRKGGVFTGNM
jgi:hypothetical protein